MTLDERAEALYKRLNACVDTSRCISLEELKQCEQEEHADVAAIAKELQAVVAACAEVEAAKEAVYSTLVDERKRLATLEAAVKEAGDAWQVQTNVREGITFRLKMKALLALRAGMR